MAELDGHVGLVGRADIVSLVEYLSERDARRPLPVTVVYGPGGSGKSAVITHLERYFNANTPLAKVELTQDGSRTPQDVLDAIFFRLCRDSHKQFGKLRLPRYETARIIRACAAETAAVPKQHLTLRRRLAEQLTLSTLTEGVREGGEISAGVAGFFGRALRPVTRWMYGAAVIAPRPLRWLLAGPKFAAAFRWYEREAPALLQGAPEDVHVDNIGVHIHGLINDEPVSDATRDQLNRFMVAALLADLRAEYRSRRTPKVNCLVLLDNADLLAPDEAELWAVGGTRHHPSYGRDLLDLFADEMRDHPDTPLLVLATKQAAPAADGFGSEACAVPDDTDEDPRTEARKRYDRWRSNRVAGGGHHAVPRARTYLPLPLDALTLSETRQLLRQLSELDERTMRADVRVRELYDATHGHPQAIQLLSRKLSLRSTKNSTVPAVRSIFDELARPEESDADRDDTVGGYLLMRFLQRFRTEAAGVDGETDEQGQPQGAGNEVRRETTALLARLAAPLWLDESTVDLLTSDRTDEDRRRIKDYLGILSFVTTDGEGTWRLHPLLRDLLLPELLHGATEPGFSYREVHEELVRHYAENWDPGAALALHHHLLALGERRAVAGYVAQRVERGKTSEQWQADLEQLVRAPTVGTGASEELKEWLRDRNLWRAASDSPTVEQVLDSLWALRASTSRQRWDESSLGRLDDALSALARNSGSDVELWRTWCRRLISGSDPVEVPRLRGNLSAGASFPYPRVLLSRHSVQRFVAAVLALALTGYGLAYGVHVAAHCDRAGFGSFAPVRTLWDDTMALERLPSGQCIGLAEDVRVFSAGSGPLRPDERQISELSRLIQQENARVERRHARTGAPYATVVVATILSSNQQPPRHGLSVGVNELRGAYLAQRQWNGFARRAGVPSLPVRLVLANLGSASAHADDVAEQIRQLVRRDPTVIGVTGLGQTRDAVVQAVGSLGPAERQEWDGVPMVASAATGNILSGKPYYFRVAVPNRRQAEVGARFLAGLDGIERRKPFLLYDQGDPYSAELAAEYEDALTARPETFAEPVHLRYEPRSPRLRSVMEANLERMCSLSRDSGRDPLLIFTGRANEVFSMLSALGTTDCAVDTPVFGGDDLSQLDTSESSYLHDLAWLDDGQLMFTTFGTTRRGWRQADPPPQTSFAQQRFFGGYREMMRTRPEAFRSPPNGHIVAAYDALTLLMDAAERAGSAQRTLPTRAEVYHALRATTGAEVHHGASGVIDFGPVPSMVDQAGADPVRKFVAVQRVAGLEGDLHTEHVTAFGVRNTIG